MRASFMHEAGDLRVEDVPDSTIKESTDALVRVTATCSCGSDLHPYHGYRAMDDREALKILAIP